jgi:hypothetical protein
MSHSSSPRPPSLQRVHAQRLPLRRLLSVLRWSPRRTLSWCGNHGEPDPYSVFSFPFASYCLCIYPMPILINQFRSRRSPTTSSRRHRRCSCPAHPGELRSKESIVWGWRKEQRPLLVKSEHDVSDHFSLKSRRWAARVLSTLFLSCSEPVI